MAEAAPATAEGIPQAGPAQGAHPGVTFATADGLGHVGDFVVQLVVHIIISVPLVQRV